MLDWKNKLNEATDAWSLTHEGSGRDIQALNNVVQVVKEINEKLGCNLIEPTHTHMYEINRCIGDIEPSVSLEDLIKEWNSLAKINVQ